MVRVNIFFHPENRAVSGIMRKNMIEADRPQLAV
jgi:hypothetical protein